MKRSCIVFILAVLAMTPGNARPTDGVEVSLSSGYVIPSSPMAFANYWKMQYGGTVAAGISLSESITLIGAFEYYRFKLDEDGLNEAFNTGYMRDIWIFQDVSMAPSADPSTITTVSANVRVSPLGLSGVLSPYVTGGAGVMFFSQSEITLPTTSILVINGAPVAMTAQQTVIGGAQTAVMFQLGVGCDVRIAESFEMFIEARYTSGLTEGLGTMYVPLTAGVRLHL